MPSSVIKEVYLQPGEFFFGGGNTRIRTLLGSCVSITLWHPRLRIGGMCHYMLHSRGTRRTALPNGKYADEAVEMFLKEVRNAGTRPEDYEVKLFGGGQMFDVQRQRGHAANISVQNVEAARIFMRQHGFFNLKGEDLGGAGHRNIVFELWSGDVWRKRNKEADEAAEERTR